MQDHYQKFSWNDILGPYRDYAFSGRYYVHLLSPLLSMATAQSIRLMLRDNNQFVIPTFEGIVTFQSALYAFPDVVSLDGQFCVDLTKFRFATFQNIQTLYSFLNRSDLLWMTADTHGFIRLLISFRIIEEVLVDKIRVKTSYQSGSGTTCLILPRPSQLR